MKMDFRKSLKNSPSLDIDFLKLAKINFRSTDFIDTTKEPRVSFQLFSDESQKSKNYPSQHFTNYIGKLTDQTNVNRVLELFKDLSSLQRKELTTVRLDPRIISILKLYNYEEIDDIVETNVVKADIKDSLSNQNGIRVFLTFEHKENNGEWIIHTKVILVDLYHLVIPSKFKGMSAIKAKEHIYNLHRNNKQCLSEYTNTFV